MTTRLKQHQNAVRNNSRSRLKTLKDFLTADERMKEFTFDGICRFFQSMADADWNEDWPAAEEVLGILRTLIVATANTNCS